MSRRINSSGQRRIRRFIRASMVTVLAGLTLAVSSGISYSAERVVVRGGLHPDFGRLVFDWKAPVSYTVAATGQELTITFERPMEGRFDRARDEIPEYIGAVRFEDGGKRVVIDLKRPMKASHFVNEGSVVVDLRFAGTAGATRARATQAGATSKKAPKVPVLISNRNGYTRIVFDWPVRAGYRFTEKNHRVSIVFDRPGVLAVPASAVSVSPLLTDLQSTRRDDGTPRIDLGVAGRVRHFRDGRKVVVDILSDKNAGQSAPKDPAAPKVLQANAAPAPSSPPSSSPAAAKPAADIGAPVQLVPVKLRATEADKAAAAALPKNARSLAMKVTVELDGARLSFPFAKPTSMTAFRRGGWLWLVFDRPFRIDTAPIDAAEEFISAAEQLEHGEATILRLVTVPGFNASVSREGNQWDIVIAPQLMRPESPLAVSSNPGRDANVSLGPTVPSTLLVLNDPEVGDRIFAVTVAVSGHGVARAHQFSDFRILPSVQGVAVIPYADGLKVEPQTQRILISSASGLRMATAKARRRVLASSPEKAAAERMFDFTAWRHSELGSYVEAENQLLERIEAAVPDARNAVRLELAQFSFAHGMSARARGIIQIIEVESKDSTVLATFRALRGAINYMLGDFKKARVDLLHRDLDNEPEIVLWRAALAAQDGQFAEATYGLRQSDRFVQSYPNVFRKRFALLGAETALANRDALGGEFWLAIAEGANLSKIDREYQRVLRANIAALDGEIDTALKMYESSIRGRDRRSRARAVLEKTELLLVEGEITAEQAIDDLDRLRYVWRGDEIEFRVLRRLGELQIATGKFRDGLQSLKRLVTNFADHRLTPDIAVFMRTTFANLYETGEIESLPPVMAIALFNDFRELAPAGTEGDDMIRRLADRLVSVDLLPQAAELLAHQVDFRLKGEAKARVGARLAVIHLLNRDPGEALAAIADSHSDGVSSELDEERSLITARAHARLDALDKALAALAGNESEAADRVRADIMWKKRDWVGVAEVFGRLAGDPPAKGQSLDDVRSRYVLSRAVALALGNNLRELVTLHGRFAPAMVATPFGADFQVIAAVDSGATDFQDVMRRVTVADDFQAFMAGYRARLAQSTTATEEASTIN